MEGDNASPDKPQEETLTEEKESPADAAPTPTAEGADAAAAAAAAAPQAEQPQQPDVEKAEPEAAPAAVVEPAAEEQAEAAPVAADLSGEVAALQEKVREYEQRFAEVEDAKAVMESREARLGERLMAEMEKNKQLAQPEVDKKNADFENQIAGLSKERDKAKAAESVAKDTLKSARSQMELLESKVKELEEVTRANNESRLTLQRQHAEQNQAQDTEVQKALEQRREALTEKVTAEAQRDVYKTRAGTLQDRLEESVKALEDIKAAHTQEKKELRSSEDQLRVEVRNLRTQVRVADSESTLLKTQNETTHKELQQTAQQLRKLQTLHQGVEAERRREREGVERDRQFMQNEIGRLKAFVSRLEEGKTDKDIMEKLLGMDSIVVDEDALGRLAAAQRLVAEELDLSMSTAYSKWLDLRSRLELAEEENARLLQTQQSVINTCESMAPAIYQQQRELQQREKQLYHLQGHYATLRKDSDASRKEVAALQAELAEHNTRHQALSLENGELRKSLARWSAEEITTEGSKSPALQKVVERNTQLEKENATIKAQVQRDADAGLREKDIEARAMEKLGGITAEHDRIVQELDSVADALSQTRKQRDHILNLLYTHAVQQGDKELQHELRVEAKTAEADLSETPSSEGTPTPAPAGDAAAPAAAPAPAAAAAAALVAEAAQQKTSMVNELKGQLSEADKKLRDANAKLAEMTSRMQESDVVLRRERSFKEALNAQLLDHVASSKERQDAENKRQQDLIAAHEASQKLSQKVREVEKSLREETSQRETLEAEVAHLRTAKETVEGHYREAVAYSAKMEKLAGDLEALVEGLRAEQEDVVHGADSVTAQQAAKIKQLEEQCRADRQEREVVEERARLRYRGAKQEQFRLEDELKLARDAAAQSKYTVDMTQDTLQRAEERSAFLEQHLRKLLASTSTPLQDPDATTAAIDDNEAARLKAELAAAKKSCDSLTLQLDSYRASAQGSDSEVIALKAQIDELTGRAKQAEEELENCKAEEQERVKVVADQLAQAQAANVSSADLMKEVVSEKDNYAKMFARCEAEKIDMAQLVEQLNFRNTELQGVIESNRTARNKQSTELGDITSENKKLRGDLSELRARMADEVSKTKQVISLESEKLSGLQKQLDIIKSENTALKAAVAEKETAMKQLIEEKAVAASNSAAVGKQGEARIASLETLVRQRNTEVTKLNEEVQALKRRIAADTAAHAKAAPPPDPSVAQLMQRHQMKEGSLCQKISRLETALDSAREGKSSLEGEVASLKSQISELRKEKGVAEGDRLEADRRVEKVSREMDLIDNAKGAMRDATRLERENGQLKARIAELEDVITAHEERTKATQSRINDLEAEVAKLVDEKQKENAAFNATRAQDQAARNTALQETANLRDANTALKLKVQQAVAAKDEALAKAQTHAQAAQQAKAQAAEETAKAQCVKAHFEAQAQAQAQAQAESAAAEAAQVEEEPEPEPEPEAEPEPEQEQVQEQEAVEEAQEEEAQEQQQEAAAPPSKKRGRSDDVEEEPIKRARQEAKPEMPSGGVQLDVSPVPDDRLVEDSLPQAEAEEEWDNEMAQDDDKADAGDMLATDAAAEGSGEAGEEVEMEGDAEPGGEGDADAEAGADAEAEAGAEAPEAEAEGDVEAEEGAEDGSPADNAEGEAGAEGDEQQAEAEAEAEPEAPEDEVEMEETPAVGEGEGDGAGEVLDEPAGTLEIPFSSQQSVVPSQPAAEDGDVDDGGTLEAMDEGSEEQDEGGNPDVMGSEEVAQTDDPGSDQVQGDSSPIPTPVPTPTPSASAFAPVGDLPSEATTQSGTGTAFASILANSGQPKNPFAAPAASSLFGSAPATGAGGSHPPRAAMGWGSAPAAEATSTPVFRQGTPPTNIFAKPVPKKS